jgi:transposase
MLHYYSLKEMKRPAKVVKVHRKERVSSMAVISLEGLVTVRHSNLPFNKELFMDFIINQLCHAIKPTHKYLLMDNVSFHHSYIIIEAIQSIGLEPLFIPSYSPQYNPIEECFSYIKHHFRRSQCLGLTFQESIDASFESIATYTKFASHYKRAFRSFA